MAAPKKTNRLLFFTGGTDSTLLLIQMLKLLTHNVSDELTLVCAATPMLKSGREENVQAAILALAKHLCHSNVHINNSVMKRVSVLVVMTQMYPERDLKMVAFTDLNQEVQLKIPVSQPNEDIFSSSRTLLGQELVILSLLPSIVPYLKKCRNVFYLGACGSDIATRTVSRLERLFELQFKLMLVQQGEVAPQNSWMPSIEFPLMDLRKSDVIMLLDGELAHNYIVDKIENVFEFYAMNVADGDDMALHYFTAYHEIRMNILKTKGQSMTTTLTEFIRKGEIWFKAPTGEEVKYSPEEIEAELLDSKLKLYGRATGSPMAAGLAGLTGLAGLAGL